MKKLMVRESLNEKNLVVQSNSLIESSYSLSISEQKIILAVVSMINPGDKDFKKYKFKISDFMKLAGIDDRSAYKRLRDLSKGLMEKVIQIQRPKSILYVNWFASAEYFEGQGFVEIEVSPKLKPYLLGLKERFTQYQLRNIIQFKSFYSIRIYELLKQYEKIGERTFELKKLRQILGVAPETYKLYADFKKKILVVAQKELRQKADLTFEFEEIKKKKKVEKIKFSIIKNDIQEFKQISSSKVCDKSDQIQDNILNVIPEKLRTASVINLLKSYIKNGISEDYIISNISYSVKRFKTNFLIYLKKALLQDYAHDERELAIKVRELEEKQKKFYEEEAKLAKKQEELKKEKESKEQEHIYFLVSQLPEHDRKKIEKLAAEDMHRFHMKPTITEADKMLYTSIAFKKLGYNKSSNS